MFTNSIYAIDDNQKSIRKFWGLHKKSLQREVENYQEQKRKLWKPLKIFPNKKM